MKFRDINGNNITYNPKALMPEAGVVQENSKNQAKPVLTEFRPLLLESVEMSPDKPFRVKTILQVAGMKNQNGRVYSKPILMREASKYNQNFVQTRRSLGELDHPEASVVSLKNASHIISEIYWEGNNLIGVLEILNTPNGKIAKQLIMDGVQIGISSRGLGTVSKSMEENADVVNDDYELLAFDLVSNSSVPTAQLETLAEGVDRSITTEVQQKPIMSQNEAFELYKREYDYILKRALYTEEEIKNNFR